MSLRVKLGTAIIGALTAMGLLTAKVPAACRANYSCPGFGVSWPCSCPGAGSCSVVPFSYGECRCASKTIICTCSSGCKKIY